MVSHCRLPFSFLLCTVHKSFTTPQATFQRDKSFILSAAATLLVFQAQFQSAVQTHAYQNEAGTDVGVRSEARGLSVNAETKLHKTMSYGQKKNHQRLCEVTNTRFFKYRNTFFFFFFKQVYFL